MKYIIASCLLTLMIITAFNLSDAYTIKGVVKDNNGDPVPFATIVEKGTKNMVASDANGNFTIKVSGKKAKLVISAVGYENLTYAVKGETKVTIELVAASHSLQDVVVVTGLGVKREAKELGYATTKVADASSYSISPLNVSNGLAGQVSGVYIRGTGSLNASSSYTWSGTDKKEEASKYISNDSTDFNREGYDAIVENRFLAVDNNPLSTFSIDVDAASYSNVRRYLQANQLPPAGAIRIEELVNYFHYEYPQPTGEDPFSVSTEMSSCPWNPEHKLVMIGLQGKKIPTENLPASNLVFLIDVSGSMMDENKLPLVKQSMGLLVDQLREEDKVSIVVYAGNAGMVLKPTSGDQKEKIKYALNQLEAGGSTAGGEGILLAYKTAKDNFIKGGNNRVILCTDGDFNVGVSSDAALEKLIEEKRETGVFLSVLGFGEGNYQDGKMQKLADKGNGNHSYIDNISEAKKVFVSEFGGTLFTIAKDVKLQIEFNPAKVQAYRLIGYENRILNKEDFNNDKKDAGDMGSGHTVTALYEVIPVGVKNEFAESVDPLKYVKPKNELVDFGGEIMNIKLRYKQPDGITSKLLVHPVNDNNVALSRTSDNFRFAAAVAEFGMLLLNSNFKQQSTFDNAWKMAKNALGSDDEGYRSEFLKLVKNAGSITAGKKVSEDEDGMSIR